VEFIRTWPEYKSLYSLHGIARRQYRWKNMVGTTLLVATRKRESARSGTAVLHDRAVASRNSADPALCVCVYNARACVCVCPIMESRGGGAGWTLCAQQQGLL
jgi:hypothetical protein